MTTYASKHGKGLPNTHKAIQERKPFKAGNLTATTTLGGVGRLPMTFASIAREWELDYVVYSYATPIAWHSQSYGWEMPDAKYSPTTSNHQSLVRQALVMASIPARMIEE